MGGLGLGDWGPMDAGALRAVLRARIGLLLGERRDAVSGHGGLWRFLFVSGGVSWRCCIVCVLCSCSFSSFVFIDRCPVVGNRRGRPAGVLSGI